MSTNSIGELLRGYLIAQPSISALIGTRMYPYRLPQKPTLPALVYQRISGQRIGILHGPASLAEPRYQIDAWTDPNSGGVAGALALGSAVRQLLESYTGTWTDGSVSAFVQVRFADERDYFEEDVLGGLCRHSADYFVAHATNGGTL